MKRIKATFKGRNGSMGFINGKEYDLVLNKSGACGIVVFAWIGVEYCIYGSFLAFLNNWDNISESCRIRE